MSPTTLGLVLIAAVLHATWNLLAKRVTSDVTAFVWLTSAISFGMYLPVAALTIVLTHPAALTPIDAVFIVGTGLIHLVYFVLLQRGYRSGDLSLVYPLARGSGPLLAALCAIVVFGERPGPWGFAGIGCILGGVVAATTGLPRTGDGRGRLSIVYGLATGASIAAYTVWDKQAVSALAISPILYDVGRNAATAIVMAPWAAGRGRAAIARTWDASRREAAGVAFLSPLAYILVLFALVRAPVSLVAPAREISIVLGTLLGARFFGEGFALRRVLAAALMFAGIVALARG